MLATVLLLGASPRAIAQAPPDPRMLLNLDLFAAPGTNSGAPGDKAEQSGSLIDQIRTLRVLGYLGHGGRHGAAPDATPSGPPPNAPYPPAPYGDQPEVQP